jgi:hypothetical protein
MCTAENVSIGALGGRYIMTQAATLRLPDGQERRYETGGHVTVLRGCPEAPDGVPDGIITAFPDRSSVVIMPDGGGGIVGPIPVQSLYLVPAA